MDNNWKGLGTYGTVGLEFILSIAAGTAAGNWLDKRLGWVPWLTLLGIGFGTAAGVRTLYRAAKQAERQADEDAAQQREERRKYHGSGKSS